MPEIEIHATLSGISPGARFIYARENEIFCVSPVPFVVGVNLGKACGLLYLMKCGRTKIHGAVMSVPAFTSQCLAI